MDPDRIRKLFQKQHRRGLFPGGQIVVRRHGKVLLDEVIGTARGYRPEEQVAAEPVEHDTRFAVFSASKPMIAMTVARAEELGLLDVSAPIAELIPEFARHGKHAITTLDVLTHRSGLIVPEVGSGREDWPRFDKVFEKLINAKPRFPRGTMIYHPYEFGYLLAGIVERVTKKKFVEFFDEEIAKPAELHGLCFHLDKSEIPKVAKGYFLGKKPVDVSGVLFNTDFEPIANTTMMESFVPGGNVTTSGRTLAMFYELLINDGVASSGKRIFSSAQVARYTSRQALGFDRLNRFPIAIGLGFMVGTRYPSYYGWWETQSCFGHSGAVSSVGFGDRQRGIAAAIITNGNNSIPDLIFRFTPLAHAIRALA